MKYSFIAQHKKTWPVDVMCRLMGINRYSYYSYERRHKKQPVVPKHKEIVEWIKKIAQSSRYTYGSRRIRKALNALGYPIGVGKTKRLMKEANVLYVTERNIK